MLADEINDGLIIKQDWPTPIPLLKAEMTQTLPYPINCLPRIIRQAVTDYHHFGQQPLPLIACGALANVSLACQTLANVCRDRLLRSPVSLYFLVCASSGERKTAVDYVFGQGIREWEQQTRENLQPDRQLSYALHRAWVAEKEGLLAQIRKKSLLGKSTEELKYQFAELMENEPEIPLLPMLFFEDATQEALATHMAYGWPSASLWSDEGGIILGGHSMQNNATKFVALLNRLWDGKPFIAHRKTAKSFTVADRRLTVNIMLQPLILEQMLAKDGGVNRQSGFMARSLIAYPESAMGDRFYQEPPEALASLHAFHQQLKGCLNQSLVLDSQGCGDIPNLNLSPKAKTIWVKFFNKIEAELTTHWSHVRDFASKSAENVARLAALFHLFSGDSGDISSDNIESAIEIVQWHLCEASKLFQQKNVTQQDSDAIKLLSWIKEKALTTTSKRELQQYSPIRDKQRRDEAINTLMQHYYLREQKQDGKTVLLVNPSL